jgi:hypothetical protein
MMKTMFGAAAAARGAASASAPTKATATISGHAKQLMNLLVMALFIPRI